jgi:hypothetical protein
MDYKEFDYEEFDKQRKLVYKKANRDIIIWTGFGVVIAISSNFVGGYVIIPLTFWVLWGFKIAGSLY